MAERRSATKRIDQDRSIPSEEEGWRLGAWVFFSMLIHVMLVLGFFVFPHVPLPKAPEYPIYTVELLGGEILGGRALGTEIAPVAPPKPKPKPKAEPKKVKVEPPPPVPVVEKKEPVKKEAVKKEEKVVLKAAKKEPPKEPKKEVAKEPQANQGLPEQLREKLFQAALDRVKNRVEAERQKKEEEVLQSGPGEGEGADAPGEGGKGGGRIVKGVEFLIYRNRMLYLIRESWTWVGKRDDLEVKVWFGVREDGEIVGLRIMQASGDPSYDDSVFRAVKKASPLPPPPENYREEFMEVELTFRPKDLSS